jgi:hypothetical protein
MSLCLVLHDLDGAPAAAEKAFFEAIYEIAPDHWPVTERAVLVGTGVSPAYLRDHLLRALAATETRPSLLLITRVSADLAWHNLPQDGEAWLQEVLG